MIGPALPPHLQRKTEGKGGDEEGKRRVGPALPPDFRGNDRGTEIDEEDEDGGSCGPAPPPSKKSKLNKVGPALPSARPDGFPGPPPVDGSDEEDCGPTAPPTSSAPAAGDDSEGEDIVGPRPPPAGARSEKVAEAESWAKLREEDVHYRAGSVELGETATGTVLKKREDWMLIPPEAKPTGTGNKFRAKGAIASDPTWAKAPGDGGKSSSQKGGPKTASTRPADLSDDEEAEELRTRFRQIDESTRGTRSLVELHQEKLRDDKKGRSGGLKKDVVTSWDRDRDLINNHKKADPKAYMSKLGNLGDRFSSGGRRRS
mmetsp:Transcript_10408/g.31813  ORF Transcript_10408/g.31813 Transcript_10408/m.31813 type:complete len:316 (-) Transcript_10408:1217-2164(-)